MQPARFQLSRLSLLSSQIQIPRKKWKILWNSFLFFEKIWRIEIFFSIMKWWWSLNIIEFWLLVYRKFYPIRDVCVHLMMMIITTTTFAIIILQTGNSFIHSRKKVQWKILHSLFFAFNSIREKERERDRIIMIKNAKFNHRSLLSSFLNSFMLKTRHTHKNTLSKFSSIQQWHDVHRWWWNSFTHTNTTNE